MNLNHPYIIEKVVTVWARHRLQILGSDIKLRTLACPNNYDQITDCLLVPLLCVLVLHTNYGLTKTDKLK